MSEGKSTADGGRGVYYSRRDYAGFLRRLSVDLVDFILVILLVVIVTVVLGGILPPHNTLLPHILFWSGVVIVFLYFVVLKRSSFRTPGYRIGGVRIVNLQGERPGIWALTMRTLFIFAGPLNMPVDVLWLTADRHRQALRDKFAHTYVVRHDAVPVGHGTIGYPTYTILGVGFVFAEVHAPENDDP